MNYDALKLKNQLCFPLYACSKEVIKKYKPHLDEIGLTYTQYITMMALWEHCSLSVKELGEFLYLDSGTLTPLLKKLEALGYVCRERDIADERSVMITLTDAGIKLKGRAVDIPMKIAGCLPLEPAEAQTLYTLLYKILATVKEA